jgi:hypothetical protein
MVREKYAVAIRYEVDYRFKSSRIGTVEPVTTKDSSITKVLEYDCKGGAVCTYAVEDAALTHTDSYDYGYGITLYNGTMPEDYGNQVFLITRQSCTTLAGSSLAIQPVIQQMW